MPTSLPFPGAQEVFSAEMASRLEKREGMIDEVLSAIVDRGFQPDEYFDRLCLDEVISNAVVHGNGGDADKKVHVRVFCSKDRWGWEIADEGAGFDWRALIERVEKGVDQDLGSGRGLALVMATGAQVEFLDDGRRVRVVRVADKK